MNTFLWILAGGALGWVAYSVAGLNASWGMFVSVVIGAMGGVLGGKLLAPIFFGAAAPEGVAIAALFVATAVAAGCLALSNLLHNRFES